MTLAAANSSKPLSKESLTRVTIRFAGDSGDGIQLTGSQFTTNTALAGYDLATLPDYPAEIRAPGGTLPGVSAFQIQFASDDIFTPGDAPDVLVSMNAAALRKNLHEVKRGGLLIANTNGFAKRDLEKAGYTSNPLEDGTLTNYRLVPVPLTDLTERALDETDLSTNDKRRCKNFFALGLLFWLFDRKLNATQDWLGRKFGKKPDILEANLLALKGGYLYGDVSEIFTFRYEIGKAHLEPGTYRNITGNTAVAMGFVAAARRAGLQLFLGSYPITPASDILHDLSRLRNFGVTTFQAEDEIAAVCSTIGAAYAGNLAITTTSGPGLALKSEGIGLGLMAELPMVIVNVQRGGPSTGLPTKTEQADLLQAMYGRSSESPVAVLAIRSPADAFACAYEAARIALKYMTPVILLSDGYIANGAEPWRVPDVDTLDPIDTEFRTDPDGFQPYLREPATLSRPWAIPGTPGLQHRIGGLEKEHISGNVCYDPMNHDRMCRLRGEKILRIRNDIPPCTVRGAQEGKLLVLGWGSTHGSIWEAVRRVREDGGSVGHLHLRWIHPLPRDLAEVLGRFEKILIPEINLGQLRRIIHMEFLRETEGFNLVRGLPFKAAEIEEQIRTRL